MNQAILLKVATRFRAAIEAIPIAERPIGLQKFPKGACGDSALLLGAYLKDIKIDGFDYICGSRGDYQNNTWTSHAWLQNKDFIIDITADQFPDAPTAIIVSDSSTWHASFEVDSPKESDFRLWSGYGADILKPVYSLIMLAMRNSPNQQGG